MDDAILAAWRPFVSSGHDAACTPEEINAASASDSSMSLDAHSSGRVLLNLSNTLHKPTHVGRRSVLLKEFLQESGSMWESSPTANLTEPVQHSSNTSVVPNT
eukprot:6464019-Amphidinium_carterae.1